MTDNFIYIRENALSNDTCNNAIDFINESINLEKKFVTYAVNNSRNDISIVDYKSSVPEVKDISADIKSVLKHHYKEYNALYEINELPTSAVLYNSIKYQKAEAGGGFTNWHQEQDKSYGNRFAVWMIYLNTVSQGGCTEFLYQDYAVKPQQGTLVIWPAAYTHKHRSAPDLQQDKYIVTGWFVFPDEFKKE